MSIKLYPIPGSRGFKFHTQNSKTCQGYRAKSGERKSGRLKSIGGNVA
jgi:hypothetical protein